MAQSLLAGLVLLVIGDSHMAGSDYLISTLHDALTNDGAIVHSYGFCGAQGENWVYGTTVSCGRAERHGSAPPLADRGPQERTWPLRELIERHHPDMIIVELGDTMAAYGQSDLPRAWIYEQVRTLTVPNSSASKSKCGGSIATVASGGETNFCSPPTYKV